MSSPRQDICWIEDSIRPYESLWSVLNRFFALNVITSTAFAKEFFTRGWFSAISTSVLGDPPSFSHEKFYAAIGLTPKEYSPLDLSYLKSTHLAVEKTSLKYCPVCLDFYYHSIFFQLSWMKVCPVHNVELSNICPHCGHFLDTRITASITKKPYSCTNCETELFKVSRKAALFPPNLEGSEKLKEVNEWCNFILNIPNNYAVIGMVKNGIPTKWFYPIYNALATKPIPNCLEVLSPYNKDYLFTSASFKLMDRFFALENQRKKTVSVLAAFHLERLHKQAVVLEHTQSGSRSIFRLQYHPAIMLWAEGLSQFHLARHYAMHAHYS